MKLLWTSVHIAGLRKAAADNETGAYARPAKLRWTLPDVADTENVEASGNNGVLEITIPKRAQAQPKDLCQLNDGMQNDEEVRLTASSPGYVQPRPHAG